MRKALSPPEARLWKALRSLRREGLIFRRQAPVRGYYLDFACLGRRIDIEVDGAHHFDPERMRRDRIRDRILGEAGFAVLRISAVDVLQDLHGVIGRIRALAGSRPYVWERAS
jgi:very-short-patch-repair endonuclease